MKTQSIDNDKALDLYNEGKTKMACGEYEEAIVAFESSVSFSPHYKTLELLGECHLELASFCSAICALAAATTLSNQPRAPFLCARAFEALGMVEESRKLTELSLNRNPQYGLAIELLAKLDAEGESQK